MTALLVVLAVVAVVALGVVGYIAAQRRRPPRREDGVASFQRHLDALSPEARRPTVQRLEDVTRRDEPASDSGTEGDPRPGAQDGA